ncbi:hypothetical protein SADUNF_Sadunf08G0133300 [Salix dunnii]|uniref:Uncharacterized protein n=1 Tax=Salix dunnii TaxID=1413687 RepID=A0A835JUF2_9ROSI|nr:hypothetical protein SADUNF_Sadunf08G0133300 [Salix dunnii]
MQILESQISLFSGRHDAELDSFLEGARPIATTYENTLFIYTLLPGFLTQSSNLAYHSMIITLIPPSNRSISSRRRSSSPLLLPINTASYWPVMVVKASTTFPTPPFSPVLISLEDRNKREKKNTKTSPSQ